MNPRNLLWIVSICETADLLDWMKIQITIWWIGFFLFMCNITISSFPLYHCKHFGCFKCCFSLYFRRFACIITKFRTCGLSIVIMWLSLFHGFTRYYTIYLIIMMHCFTIYRSITMHYLQLVGGKTIPVGYVN